MGFVSTPCGQRRSSFSRSHNIFTSPTRASPASYSTRRPGSKQAAVTDHLFIEKIVLPNGVVDYYEVLGVDDDAGVEDIKKAYRALAKECHPDYLGDEGHNICILLNEAYETLSCPNRLKLYNTELEEALLDAKDDFTGIWWPHVMLFHSGVGTIAPCFVAVQGGFCISQHHVDIKLRRLPRVISYQPPAIGTVYQTCLIPGHSLAAIAMVVLHGMLCSIGGALGLVYG